MPNTNASKKILIADDDPSIQEILNIILKEEGYHTLICQPEEVINSLEEHCPDLILLDVIMKGVNGRDICHEIRKIEAIKHTVIVLLSANKDAQSIALECGADDFIPKPFDLTELLKKIQQHLDKKAFYTA